VVIQASHGWASLKYAKFSIFINVLKNVGAFAVSTRAAHFPRYNIDVPSRRDRDFGYNAMKCDSRSPNAGPHLDAAANRILG
jgi:hypothetical protein